MVTQWNRIMDTIIKHDFVKRSFLVLLLMITPLSLKRCSIFFNSLSETKAKRADFIPSKEGFGVILIDLS